MELGYLEKMVPGVPGVQMGPVVLKVPVALKVLMVLKVPGVPGERRVRRVSLAKWIWKRWG